MMQFSQRVAANTPADRDRFLDLLRVASILLVVVGHWLVRVIIQPDGELQARYLLEVAPGWQWATLLAQVMPIFFFVGGALNAASWERARGQGVRPAVWVSRRASRLLSPTFPLLILLTPLALLFYLNPALPMVLEFRVAVFPLWFLGAYLAVIALTPVVLRWHERMGSGVLLVLAGLAAIVDILRFTLLADGPMLGTQPGVGMLNLILVWVLVHQLGLFWHEGRLPQGAGGQWLMVLTGAAMLALLIGLGPWPLTMVPIEGSDAPNNAGPPTLAMVGLCLVQMGLALRLRGPLTRWLQRPRPWALVALIGAQLIPIYLWHQPAMVLVANLGHGLGLLPAASQFGGEWWALRPLWLVSCALMLALLLALAQPLERLLSPRQLDLAAQQPGSYARVLLGALLVALGIGGLIETGLVHQGWPGSLPWLPAGVFVLGCLLLRVLRLPLRD